MQTAQTCLVTGGAGFIGSHIVEALVNKGLRPRVVDNLSTGSLENLEALRSKIEFIQGDLSQFDTALEVTRNLDVVYHLAALPSVPVSVERPLECNRHGLQATLNLLHAAQQNGVRRLVYTSSSSVYGGLGPFPQQEDRLPHPLSPYAASKLCGEHYCLSFAHCYDLDTVCLRYFNVFGPRQPVNSLYSAAFPALISRMLRGERPTIYGDGLQTRDFVYVSNVVDANLLAGSCPKRLNGIALNIAEGKRTSMLQLVEQLNVTLGTSLEPMFEPARAGDVRDSLADISRVRAVLGYEPKVGLTEGLQQTVAYFKSLYDINR